MLLSFSTCWNSGRHVRGDEMLEEIVSLGFDTVELGHGIRLSLLDGIERYLANHPLTVSSLHNFCPLPVEILHAAPDCYQCTSHRPEERQRAQKLTLQTIDYAVKWGAGSVVLHLGSVPIGAYTQKLFREIKRNHYLSRGYIHLKLEAIQKREAYSLYDRVADWLQPVVEHARDHGIRLGVENRIDIETFPDETEFRKLFSDFPELGYWHDFGHAQIRHNLTFIDHREWLLENARRLIGCHLHDVQFPGRDHLAPFEGIIDFKTLLPLVPDHIPLVWELSPRVTRSQIEKAIEQSRPIIPGPDSKWDRPPGQR
jgi:sugar phosphate isomerase/epimerase